MITIVHKYVWKWKDHLTVLVILVMNYKQTQLLVQVCEKLIVRHVYRGSLLLPVTVKQVDVLPSKNQVLCDLIYNVL